MAMFIVPPGGLAGFNQMTPASRRALFPTQRSRTGSRTRRKATRGKGSSRRTSGRKRSGKRSGKRKLKFGSPAWQKKYRVGAYRKK